MISALLIVTERLATGWRSDRKDCFPDEAKISSIRLTLKERSCNMSRRFFYVQLKFILKSGLTELPMTQQHGAVVEVPKDLVQRKQSEMINENPGQEAIALDLARRAALGTFPTAEERFVGLYDEDPQFGVRTGLTS